MQYLQSAIAMFLLVVGVVVLIYNFRAAERLEVLAQSVKRKRYATANYWRYLMHLNQLVISEVAGKEGVEIYEGSRHVAATDIENFRWSNPR